MRLFLIMLNGVSILLGLISFLFIGFGLQENSGDGVANSSLMVIGVPLLLISMLIYFYSNLRLKQYS